MDLDLGLSDHLVLHQLAGYLTGVSYDVDQGLLTLPLPPGEPCYTIYAPQLLHTNLSLLYFNIFFQMCKAHFIGFDPKVSTSLSVRASFYNIVYMLLQRLSLI